MACHERLVRAVEAACSEGWSEYALGFSRALWNLCGARVELGRSTSDLEQTVFDVCAVTSDAASGRVPPTDKADNSGLFMV